MLFCLRCNHPAWHAPPEGGYSLVKDAVRPVRFAAFGVAWSRINPTFINVQDKLFSGRYLEHSEGYRNEAVFCPRLQNYVRYGAGCRVQDNVIDSAQRFPLRVDNRGSF